MASEIIATGRRKTAVARIRMNPGTGNIVINGRPFEEYFKTLSLQNQVLRPFETAKLVNGFDVKVNAHGGGLNRPGRCREALFPVRSSRAIRSSVPH